MEKRTRILVIAIGVLLGFVVVTRGKSWLIDSVTKIDKQIADAKAKRDDMVFNLDREDVLRDKYLELAKKTLSLDREKSGKELRAILAGLAKSVGLSKYQIDPPTVRKNVKIEKYGGRITVVKSGVKAVGTVKQWVEFLTAFYKLPYAMQICQITLSQGMTGKKGITNKKGVTSVTLGADIDVEAIVLPRIENVPVAIVKTADLRPTASRPAANRLKRDLASHREVWKKDIFMPKTPPPKVAVRPKDGKRIPPKRGNRFERKKSIAKLIGVTRWPWKNPTTGKEMMIQEVMTRNDATKEKVIIRIGEKLDKGNLIHVDSMGAVVRTSAEELLFYPLGKELKDPQKFDDPEIAPEAWWALQQSGQLGKKGK